MAVERRDRASSGPVSGAAPNVAAPAPAMVVFPSAAIPLRIPGVAASMAGPTLPANIGVTTNVLARLLRGAPRQSAGAAQMVRTPLVTSGAISGALFDLGGIASPGVSAAGHGRLYFDAASNKLMVSENGSPFINLVGASGGVSGSGTANKLPLWTAGTTLADSAIAQSGTSIGIGTTTPIARLAVVGGGFTHNFSVSDNNTTATSFELGNTSAGARTWRLQAVGSGVPDRVGNLEIWETANSVNALTILPNGSIGVGTTAPTNTLDVYGFFRASHPAGGNVVSETTGGTNAWAKLWMKTLGHQWSIGTSNNFNGNQLYFSDESGGGFIRMAIMPNGNVGIGTTNPASNLEVSGPSAYQRITDTTSGNSLVLRGSTANNMSVTGFNYGTSTAVPLYLSVDGADTILNYAGGNVGIATTTPNFRLTVDGDIGTSTSLYVNKTITMKGIGTSNTSTALCLNTFQIISFCSSSLRYKRDVTSFNSGLDIVNRLQPITFNWKDGGARDIGLGAEDVERIEPLLVMYNKNGEVEGVKYGQLSTVFINAFKEQQKEIELLTARLRQLEEQIATITRSQQGRSEK
jgi:hypothetical protein